MPSTTRKKFHSFVKSHQFAEAVHCLNGLTMFEMLPALGDLGASTRRTILESARKLFLSYTPPWKPSFERIRWAAEVVERRTLPAWRPPGLPADQVKDAQRYLFSWMAIAKKEIGQAEVGGTKANPRILQYFKTARFWGKDDTGEENAWCGAFVAWVMEQSGYTPVAEAYRAQKWAHFGKKIPAPVYGAIGVKSRKGGNHVAFVVGQSRDGKYLYMLGGNQDDRVQIKRYPRRVWSSFHVPTNYDANRASLPVYTKPAADAGLEE